MQEVGAVGVVSQEAHTRYRRSGPFQWGFRRDPCPLRALGSARPPISVADALLTAVGAAGGDLAGATRVSVQLFISELDSLGQDHQKMTWSGGGRRYWRWVWVRGWRTSSAQTHDMAFGTSVRSVRRSRCLS
jgi:hypothetical protein